MKWIFFYYSVLVVKASFTPVFTLSKRQACQKKIIFWATIGWKIDHS